MQVVGNVISVSLETDVKKNGGGSYKGWELVYKTPEGEVRTIAKPVQGLKFNTALTSSLKELSVGDEFTLEQEKNTAGFYDVKSVTKGITAGAPANTGGTPQSRPAQVSNYETREERQARQRLIVRQSSLANAIELASGTKAKVEDVLKTAETLTDWVFEKGQVGLDNMESDIPE